MPLTVADVLALEVMREARVLAGAAVLDERQVNWVSAIEMPVEKFVRPGEFILTTGIGCGHDEALFGEFITEIMESGAAAVAVAVGKFVTEVPPSVIAAAEARGFPLVEIPWELPFHAITQAALEWIINEQNAILRRSADIHRQLLNAVLAGQGVEAIVAALGSVLGRPVAVVDKEFQLLAGHGRPARGANRPVPGDAAASTLSVLAPGTGCRLEHADLGALLAPGKSPARVEAILGPDLPPEPAWLAGIWAGRELFGFVLILQDGGDVGGAEPRAGEEPRRHLPQEGLGELEIKAIEHAATSAAVFFLKAQAVAQTEMRLRGDFVWALASGSDTVSPSAQSRAKFLGYDLGRSYRALLFDIDGFRDYLDGHGLTDESEVQRVKDRVRLIIEGAAAGVGRRIMLTNQQDTYICFLEGTAEEPAEAAAIRFARLVQKGAARAYGGLTLSCGVGRVREGDDRLAASYREAVKALQIGRIARGPGSVTTYERLGSLGLLAKLGEDEEALAFVADHIGPLIEHDHKRGSSLVETLRRYIDCGWNASRAARSLHLHRQSFLYRLGRIEELTGLCLSDTSHRFTLELCLRLHEIARGVPADSRPRLSTRRSVGRLPSQLHSP